MYSVYKYTFPDGKIYVGVTKNTVQYRKDCGYQHNKKLSDAIRTVGFKNVVVDVLSKGKRKSSKGFMWKYKGGDYR